MLKTVPVIVQMDATDVRHNFWGEGEQTIDHLTDMEIMEVMTQLHVEMECIHLADYNDYFGYERDTVAEMLGYECWEDLMQHRDDTGSHEECYPCDISGICPYNTVSADSCKHCSGIYNPMDDPEDSPECWEEGEDK